MNKERADYIIYDKTKLFEFTFMCLETEEIIIISENTLKKAFKKAFRYLSELRMMDRELTLKNKVSQ